MTPLVIGFFILTLILWIWAMIDISKSRFKSPAMKTVWLLIVLFFPVLGSIFYFQLKQQFTTKQERKFEPDFKH